MNKYKKFILSGIAAIAIVGFAAFNFILNNEGSQNKFSSLVLANIVALSAEYGEGGSGSTITGECIVKLLLLDTYKCQYKCSGCGRIWFSNPTVYKASAHNLTGKCSCGVTASPLPW
jgi:hypothetical protein